MTTQEETGALEWAQNYAAFCEAHPGSLDCVAGAETLLNVARALLSSSAAASGVAGEARDKALEEAATVVDGRAPVFAFLMGVGLLDGRGFGDDPPVINGRKHHYWWRKHLRAVLAASPDGKAPD